METNRGEEGYASENSIKTPPLERIINGHGGRVSGLWFLTSVSLRRGQGSQPASRAFSQSSPLILPWTKALRVRHREDVCLGTQPGPRAIGR